MNKRIVIMILIALLCATLAAWIANNWIKNKGASPTEVSNPIVVAAVEIPFGTKLDESHIKIIQWRSDDLPDGVFTNNADVLGKIAKNMFFPGEVITSQRVAEHLEGSVLAALINVNSRAMTVRVNDVVGVAGFIMPGNNVDILSTIM
ncbi:MAG: Flp pilus assembly protein CpaB, partial [Methyloprofundus sp.]|nr:Flp pilus assembly protein CpaB [Methyloprofundus sp.]